MPSHCPEFPLYLPGLTVGEEAAHRQADLATVALPRVEKEDLMRQAQLTGEAASLPAGDEGLGQF